MATTEKVSSTFKVKELFKKETKNNPAVFTSVSLVVDYYADQILIKPNDSIVGSFNIDVKSNELDRWQATLDCINTAFKIGKHELISHNKNKNKNAMNLIKNET